MTIYKTIAIGFDPGKTSGAMAVVYPDGRVEFVLHEAPLCYLGKLREVYNRAINNGYRVLVAVERLTPRPGKLSSAKANFELGRCMGELETMLALLNVPYQQVTPQVWQKEFGISGDKQTHIDCVKRLFPGVSLKRSEKCVKDFDGYADALLMAEYARRHMA